MDGYIYVKEELIEQLREENDELKAENEELKEKCKKLYEYLDDATQCYGDLLNKLEYRVGEHRLVLDRVCEYENL